MGWIISPRERRPADMHTWMRAQFDLAKPGGYRQTVLDVARDGTTYYVALEVAGDDKAPSLAPYTTCVVVLTQGTASRPGWGWKTTDEMMGPYEDRCPAHILARLSPVECLPFSGGFARQFRDRCRARLHGRAA